MRRRTNIWYEAICAQLRAANRPLDVDQIWQGMEASGFQHRSAVPRSTIGARLAELVQAKRIERIARRTYRLSSDQEAVSRSARLPSDQEAAS